MAKQPIAVLVHGSDGVFDPPCNGKSFQFLQDRIDGFEIGILIEVVVDSKSPGGHLLHGGSLVDHVLQDIHVVFHPAVTAFRQLPDFFRHLPGRLRHCPGGDGNPGPHPRPDQFPGGQSQRLAHQVVDSHVHGQILRVVDPIEGSGAQIGFKVTPWLSPILPVALDAGIGLDDVDGPQPAVQPLVAKQPLGMVVVVGGKDLVRFDLGNLDLPGKLREQRRRPEGQAGRSQPGLKKKTAPVNESHDTS